MFGAAGQVWLALEGAPRSLGTLSQAPEQLAALGITLQAPE